MRTTFMKSAAFMILLLTGVMSTNLFAGNKYVVNYETENNRITAKIVYVNDGTLHQHIKYSYTYDNEGRIAEKEALKWNERKSKWLPYYLHTYSYTPNSFAIEFAAWNPKAKTYNNAKERNVYQTNENNSPVSCMRYQWESETGTWNLINKINYINNVNLYASSTNK